MIRKHMHKARIWILIMASTWHCNPYITAKKGNKQTKKSHFQIHRSAITSLMLTAMSHNPGVNPHQFNGITDKKIRIFTGTTAWSKSSNREIFMCTC